MKFSTWLKLREQATDSGCIASFARPVIGQRLEFPPAVAKTPKKKLKK